MLKWNLCIFMYLEKESILNSLELNIFKHVIQKKK